MKIRKSVLSHCVKSQLLVSTEITHNIKIQLILATSRFKIFPHFYNQDVGIWTISMTAGNGADLKKPQGKFVFDEIRDENPTKTRNSFGALVGALNGILIRRKNVGNIY